MTLATPSLAGLSAQEKRSLLASLLAERASREDPFPLSAAQRRLWFLHQLEPGSAAYTIWSAIRLEGTMHVPALRAAVQEIGRRHEILRATFGSVGGEPVQRISARTLPEVPEVDVTGLRGEDREAEGRRLVNLEIHQPFDLIRGPLLRVLLLRLDRRETVVLFCIHHILADGWSIEIFRRELGVLYRAYAAGRPSPLAELPIRYLDFVEWQRRWLQSDALERQLEYWRRQLADHPALLEMPADRPRPAVQSFRGGTRFLSLSRPAMQRLQRLCHERRATVFMSLIAGFAALLHRHSGQSDICLGTPIANRQRVELEGLIGLFANTLVLRVDLAGDPDFRVLLERVRTMLLEAYEHQDLPFERLVEELKPERDLSYSPLFQVMISQSLGGSSGTAADPPEMRQTSFDADFEATHFDLTLELQETPAGGLRCPALYNTDLFDAATIVRLLDHFETLLAAAIDDPGRRLSELAMVSPAERHQLLREWSGDGGDPAPAARCLYELFEEQARRTPEAVAVVADAAVDPGPEGAEQRLTYRQLALEAARLADRLRGLGVGPEVAVGLCSGRSPETLVGLLGILAAGGIFVPLDPSHPRERLALLLEDSAARALVVEESLSDVVPALDGQVVRLRAGGRPLGGGRAAAVRRQPVRCENLAYVLYTSGTSGRPKAVAVTHREAAAHFTTIVREFGLTGADRVLQFAAPTFDVFLEEVFPTLLAGATLVLRARELWAPAEFPRRAAALGLTVVNLPTVYWEQWARAWAERAAPTPRPQPRLVVVGTEAMTPEAVRLWHRGPFAGLTLWNGYGPTEATVTATTFPVPRPYALPGAAVPLGRPLAGRTARVLDRRGRLTPLGVPGQLFLGGRGLARGYRNDPARTAASFVPDPRGGDPGTRLYATGDRSRWLAGGCLEFLGRADHQVKVRGFRIELGEVEAVLSQAPGVDGAAAVVREVAPGKKSLVAYVASRSATAGELRDFLAERLPDHMVPWTIVSLASLPVTASGKVDRQALPPPARRSLPEAGDAAPRDQLERSIAAIWEEALEVGSVGRQDNFFELGGHSLLMVQVRERLKELCGHDLSLVDLFRHPTVGSLARYLGQPRERPSARAAGDGSERFGEGKDRLRRRLRRAVRPPSNDGKNQE